MSKTKDKGLVPRLRFPEFQGNWKFGVLEALANVIDGDRGSNYPKNQDFSTNGYCLFLNAKNVTKSGFKFEVKQFVDQKKDKALRKGKLKRGDIVLTTRGSVGQFAYYSDEIAYEHLRINSGMVILRIKSECISPKYLHAFSQSPILRRHIDDTAFGNAQQQLTVAGINKFPIYYSDTEEQQKIADCLSSVDELISAQKQKLETLKNHKKGLMQQLFPAEGETVPKLRFPEFREDEQWTSKAFSKLFKIGSGKDYKHLSTGDIPVYGSGGYMLSVNDFLYEGDSVCIGRKGTINNPMLLSGKFWTVDTLFYTHDFKDCLPNFIYAYFQKINWLKYNEAGGVPSLSKVIIGNIEVYVPPQIQEQQKIADCLSCLDDLISTQNQKIELLQAHKKGLMQQLFPAVDEVSA